MNRFIVVVAVLVGLAALAAPVTDSTTDYSTMQTGNWQYGFVIGDAGLPPAGVATFTEFATVSSGQWKASDAQVGAQNTTFLNLGSTGGHPAGIGPGTQDAIVWPIRRYTTPTGALSFVYEFQNNDTRPFNTNASGTTAHVFVDGVQIALHTSRNNEDVPKAAPFIVLDAGTVVDFAADPHGVAPFPENEYSARADGFSWHIRAYAYPCSSDGDCGGGVKCIEAVCCDPAVHVCGDAGVAESDGGIVVIDGGSSTPSDAGSSSTPDAGVSSPVDAGAVTPFDAGVIAVIDSGVTVPVFDAGPKPASTDAGSSNTADGGTSDGGTGGTKVTVDQSGCGCSSGPMATSLLALGLFWVLRARKSR